jgi:hypothetical protein
VKPKPAGISVKKKDVTHTSYIMTSRTASHTVPIPAHHSKTTIPAQEAGCEAKSDQHQKALIMISLKSGDVVTVNINHETAVKRTKNSVKENGPTFIVVRTPIQLSIFPELGHDVTAICLGSTSTRWMGWLPVEEIIITPNS